MIKKRDKMTAIWINPLYHGFIKKFAAELGISNKAIVEQAIDDYVSRHPSLYHLFEEFQLAKKEYKND